MGIKMAENNLRLDVQGEGMSGGLAIAVSQIFIGLNTW